MKVLLSIILFLVAVALTWMIFTLILGLFGAIAAPEMLLALVLAILAVSVTAKRLSNRKQVLS